MDKVSFAEVEDAFSGIWHNSAEHLFHELAWEALEREGLTQYSDEKTHALIHVYAYVIQMLCEEFSNMAYDELVSYEYEALGNEPLTDAAIGWLYRDMLSNVNDSNAAESFSTDACEMLTGLIFEKRYIVADAIFDHYGEMLIGTLLYFSTRGSKYEFEDEESEDLYDDTTGFQTKEELLEYCRRIDFDISDSLTSYNGMRVMHWLSCHSCAIDD